MVSINVTPNCSKQTDKKTKHFQIVELVAMGSMTERLTAGLLGHRISRHAIISFDLLVKISCTYLPLLVTFNELKDVVGTADIKRNQTLKSIME